MFAALLLASAALGADPLPEAAQKELKLLQGEWKVVKGERNSKTFELNDDEATLVVIIHDEKWMLRATRGDETRTDDKARIVMVDATTNPKCLNLKSVAKADEGRVSEGIYKLEGDTLTICLNEDPSPGATRQRPSEFKSIDRITLVIVMKRVKK